MLKSVQNPTVKIFHNLMNGHTSVHASKYDFSPVMSTSSSPPKAQYGILLV